MQAYLLLMILLVAAGTLFDIVHKGSARYFFDNWRKSQEQGAQVGGGEMVSIAVQTAVVDVLASGEFCSVRRRIAHLLTMYGFLIYVVTTAIMVFGYPTPATPTPAILPHLWYIGALMVCVGGYWFWFFIRVDVAAEGNSPFRFVRADLFVVSLLASTTFGLIWAWLQTAGSRLGDRVLGAVSHRHHGAVRIGSVVQVLAHVLQAGRGLREARRRGERLAQQPAGARRRARERSAAPADSRAITDCRSSVFDAGDKEYHADIRLHDALRRLRTLRRHLPVRHHAHRHDLPARLQHRAQHVLGVLLVREGLPAERDRLPRLCRLRAARPQRARAAGRGEGDDLLEDQVPRRPRKEFRLPDQNHALGIDQVAGRLRGARPRRR